MKEVLGDEGYVDVRKVWDDAYNVIKEEKPDLIILDTLLDVVRRALAAGTRDEVQRAGLGGRKVLDLDLANGLACGTAWT